MVDWFGDIFCLIFLGYALIEFMLSPMDLEEN